MGATPAIPWWRGWGPILVLPTAVLLFTPADWPRWIVMWMLGGALLAGFKWLTWRRTPVAHVPAWRQLGYLLAWVGLDAKAFLQERLPAGERPRSAEWAAVA